MVAVYGGTVNPRPLLGSLLGEELPSFRQHLRRIRSAAAGPRSGSNLSPKDVAAVGGRVHTGHLAEVLSGLMRIRWRPLCSSPGSRGGSDKLNFQLTPADF